MKNIRAIQCICKTQLVLNDKVGHAKQTAHNIVCPHETC